jgi:hypothetical protein
MVIGAPNPCWPSMFRGTGPFEVRERRRHEKEEKHNQAQAEPGNPARLDRRGRDMGSGWDQRGLYAYVRLSGFAHLYRYVRRYVHVPDRLLHRSHALQSILLLDWQLIRAISVEGSTARVACAAGSSAPSWRFRSRRGPAVKLLDDSRIAGQRRDNEHFHFLAASRHRRAG